MFQPALEISRAWNLSLNRLGWGCIGLCSLSYAFGFFDAVKIDSILTSAFSLKTVLFFLALFLLSGLVGNIMVFMGTVGLPDRFAPLNNTKRAFRVSETKNELLIQTYQDAMLKFEVANGFEGTLLFSLIVILLGALSGILKPTSGTIGAEHVEQHLKYWEHIVWPLVGLFAGKLVEASATSALDAIDATLDANDKRKSEGAP